MFHCKYFLSGKISVDMFTQKWRTRTIAISTSLIYTLAMQMLKYLACGVCTLSPWQRPVLPWSPLLSTDSCPFPTESRTSYNLLQSTYNKTIRRHTTEYNVLLCSNYYITHLWNCKVEGYRGLGSGLCLRNNIVEKKCWHLLISISMIILISVYCTTYYYINIAAVVCQSRTQ